MGLLIEGQWHTDWYDMTRQACGVIGKELQQPHSSSALHDRFQAEFMPIGIFQLTA